MTDANWPDSTFVPEGPDARHFPGSHWSPFFDEPREIFERLPELLPAAMLQTGYGADREPPRAAPADWSTGFQLVWPLRVRGLSLVLRPEQDANSIASLFPFFAEGSQHTMTLREVIVGKGGLEAQVRAAWGDRLVTFFDTQYVINRAWYQGGKSFDFILSGLAYGARPAEQREHMNFLPVSGWDTDDYSFHAAVKSVKEFKDWLGQDGWRVRATVMRFGGADADLDILITRRIWSSDVPPQIGEDIEGQLWLQGYLWMPG